MHVRHARSSNPNWKVSGSFIFFKHVSIFGDTMWKHLYHIMKALMRSMLQFNETSTSLLKNCGAIMKCLYKASHSWNMG
jgi:hypothetical protein